MTGKHVREAQLTKEWSLVEHRIARRTTICPACMSPEYYTEFFARHRSDR